MPGQRVPQSGACAGRSVHIMYRPRNLSPTVTMPDLATAHAQALLSRFTEPVDIMGISTGGAIALQLAVDHPQTVRRLVIACAASSLGDSGRRRLAQYGGLIGQGKSGARDSRLGTSQAIVALAHDFRDLAG